MLAGETHHVIHRGNNRQPIVQDDEDRQRLLDLLRECAQQHQVALHGYVLMENHFHLLATPAGDEGLSSLMQALGRRYVAAFNLRHGRSGTANGKGASVPILWRAATGCWPACATSNSIRCASGTRTKQGVGVGPALSTISGADVTP